MLHASLLIAKMENKFAGNNSCSVFHTGKNINNTKYYKNDRLSISHALFYSNLKFIYFIFKNKNCVTHKLLIYLRNLKVTLYEKNH